MRNIVVRADASPILATGHIMRCLTLAHALKVQFPNVDIIFITNKLPQNLMMRLTQSKIKVILLPFDIDSENWQQAKDAKATIEAITSLNIKTLTNNKKIDLLIVDHYLIDWQWQAEVKACCHQLLVIDDLANRKHLADFLLDQTLNRQGNDYALLVPPSCQLLLGQKFMLLRDEFTQLIPCAKKKRAQVKVVNNVIEIKNILVNLGGLDNTNFTETIIYALIEYKKNNHNLTADIVMASHSPHASQIQAFTAKHNWLTLTTDCNDMANKMLKADLAIGASGATAWERCSLGLPTLAIVLADNQQLVNKNLTNQQAIVNLGAYQTLNFNNIANAIALLESEPSKYKDLVSNCFKSCDGLGVQQLLARLTLPRVTLELAKTNDLKTTFKWQSNSEIRRYSRNTQPIQYDEHKQWFLSSLTMKNRHLYIICCENNKLGILRLDKQINTQKITRYEISILIAPEAQGRKLALSAIHNIPKTFDHCEIYAHVHPDNIASQHLFTQANFIKLTSNSYLRPAYTPPTQ
ncbi:UDP-2,4-diacetamido-2,4,6-trideoxy-beta-L-altropyranose hydrolase [Colwellia sp. E2M01]|uniref:UDP-2,4-diacetamido-2,4, 6-trideoxy-beta-L-altropyranose hydrolase n=1 Tax=Colwellia sp. E2M01 TaxID=2841561 RepID=UPI001C09B1B9|nr:UDP-2,4-diacetamido-2,4,6-trideoxy-beta-L-altropyranose hydrolase [Colwellia sp. E2M01]MBU2869964.1 UDP-2,4-diacetamido-2,4,6-trideoxy-beta-L-altropyranose hydrolase [Colwellia sp. E2M01]